MSADAVDRMAGVIRAGGRRLGPALRNVLAALDRHAEPVTAEVLAAELPDVHVSSVYRSLGVLEELGLVRHLHLAHGPALYALSVDVPAVRHLVCEVCGHVVSVPASTFHAVAAEIEQQFGFVLDSDHFALPGRCVTCARP